jgi:hypothetical protein
MRERPSSNDLLMALLVLVIVLYGLSGVWLGWH